MTEESTVTDEPVAAPTDAPAVEPVAALPRKRRTGLIAAIVVVVLLAMAGAAFAVYSANQKAEAQQQAVKEASLAADEKLDKMWEQMAVRDRSWTLVDADSQGDMAGDLSRFAREDITRWSTVVAGIRRTMQATEDDAVSSAYIAVCDEVDDVLTDRRGRLDAVTDTQGLSKQLADSDADYRDGWDKLQESIHSCNADKWSQADAQAKEAQALFQNAANTCATVNKTLNDESVKRHVAWLSAQVELAKMQQGLAALGRKGGVNSYNKQIDKLNDQEAKIAGMDGEDYSPGFGWADAADAGGTFVTGMAKARDLHTEARAAVTEALTQ